MKHFLLFKTRTVYKQEFFLCFSPRTRVISSHRIWSACIILNYIIIAAPSSYTECSLGTITHHGIIRICGTSADAAGTVTVVVMRTPDIADVTRTRRVRAATVRVYMRCDSLYKSEWRLLSNSCAVSSSYIKCVFFFVCVCA